MPFTLFAGVQFLDHGPSIKTIAVRKAVRKLFKRQFERAVRKLVTITMFHDVRISAGAGAKCQ